MNTILRGLGLQIALSMALATLVSALLAITGLYLLYSLIFLFAPNLLKSGNDWTPAGVEWLMFALMGLLGLVLGVVAAIRLAHRIVTPLVSVAAAARLIAGGNLTARAALEDRCLGEAAHLVDDFNAMADALEASSKGVSRWNALIAHELRTPLTILRGRLQGLADGVFLPDTDLFRRLLAQVDGLARLVEDLRTVSLTESGHLDMRPMPTDLLREVEDVCRLMEASLRQSRFTLTLELEPCVCVVDSTRVRQALMALLENARRHARPGAVVVTLRRDSGGVTLSVADNGPGLPADFVEEAFEPFRAHVTKAQGLPGSGLGLSVVRAVAAAHGGVASYRLDEGRACFTIALPQAD